MKIKNYKYIVCAAFALATSCSDDITTSTYTVGEADNAIVLNAGITNGGNSVQTRGTRAVSEDSHAGGDNGGGHVPFKPSTTSPTKLRLRVDGTWKGKTEENITKTTTASIGAATTSPPNHNEVSFENTEKIYWDDYGTADPANMSTDKGGTVSNGTDGRDKGLTIYGVAVDGEPAAPVVDGSTGKTWNAYAWALDTDQKTNNWNTKDLLISNNVKDGTSDGTFKFDTNPRSKLLVFTHAMSKITVRLIASDGFPTTGDNLIGNTPNKFENTPDVTLTSNEGTATSNTEWPLTSGKVNITTGVVTGQADNAKVTMHTQSTTDATYTAIYDALVMPGSCFGTSDEAVIARINADGNIYYVTAKEIRKKMYADKAATDYMTEAGKNYIFNIIIKKTAIEVTATVTNWVDVTSDEGAPKININHAYGHTGTAFEGSFTLYRSTTMTGSYIGSDDKADVTYNEGAYTMTPQLYWLTHGTHYFFRGVWPQVDSKDDNSEQLGPETAQVKANAIEVQNVAYKAHYYPSDLMIGRPMNNDETATDEACKVHSDTQGICATTGKINMNFRYMMSQVKVELLSSDPSDADHIVFDANTKVEIIGGYKDGAIKLSDCTSDFTNKTTADYAMNNVATADYDSYHDAIIPQTLTDGMKFRITVQNSDNSTDIDVYEAVIKDIKVSEGGGAGIITAWAPGKIYTYTLKVTRTKLDVSATLTDWVTVQANDEDVWF